MLGLDTKNLDVGDMVSAIMDSLVDYLGEAHNKKYPTEKKDGSSYVSALRFYNDKGLLISMSNGDKFEITIKQRAKKGKV